MALRLLKRLAMKAIVCISIALVCLLIACGSNPARGLTARGDRELAVEAAYRNVEQVAQTTYTNPDGTPGGSASTVVGYAQVRDGFSLKLGDKIVDEQDFYHLAGDQQMAERIARTRAKGIRRQRIGTVVAIGSLLGAIGIPMATGIQSATYSIPLGLVGELTALYLIMTGNKMIYDYHSSAADAFKSLGQSPAAWAVPQD